MVKQNIGELQSFFSDVINSEKKNDGSPSLVESVYFILAGEFGITMKDFNKYPMPYLVGLIKASNYRHKLEQKQIKRMKSNGSRK